jgi:type IV pilus assembly protein PilN
MAHINLLPWREEERRRKKKQFYSIIAGSAVLMGVIGLATHIFVAGMIDFQAARNNFLQAEIRMVDAKIKEIQELESKKEQLISRMRIIERLQSNRPEVVHLFDEMIRLVPEGLYVQSIEQKANNLTIKGQAQSNARVSAFMRALEKSEWFTAPALNVISTKQTGNVVIREFTLQVKQSAPVGG